MLILLLSLKRGLDILLKSRDPKTLGFQKLVSGHKTEKQMENSKKKLKIYVKGKFIDIKGIEQVAGSHVS